MASEYFWINFADVRVANLDELQLNIHAEQVIKTSTGKDLECDLVIACIGMKINSEFYTEELGEKHCIRKYVFCVFRQIGCVFFFS